MSDSKKMGPGRTYKNDTRVEPPDNKGGNETFSQGSKGLNKKLLAVFALAIVVGLISWGLSKDKNADNNEYDLEDASNASSPTYDTMPRNEAPQDKPEIDYDKYSFEIEEREIDGQTRKIITAINILADRDNENLINVEIPKDIYSINIADKQALARMARCSYSFEQGSQIKSISNLWLWQNVFVVPDSVGSISAEGYTAEVYLGKNTSSARLSLNISHIDLDSGTANGGTVITTTSNYTIEALDQSGNIPEGSLRLSIVDNLKLSSFRTEPFSEYDPETKLWIRSQLPCYTVKTEAEAANLVAQNQAAIDKRLAEYRAESRANQNLAFQYLIWVDGQKEPKLSTEYLESVGGSENSDFQPETDSSGKTLNIYWFEYGEYGVTEDGYNWRFDENGVLVPLKNDSISDHL